MHSSASRPYKLVSVFALIVALVASVLAPAGVALAADGDPVDAISDSANTTIDAFDYWVYDADDNGAQTYRGGFCGFNDVNNETHEDQFLNSRDDGNAWNQRTGNGGGALQGVVKSLLGVPYTSDIKLPFLLFGAAGAAVLVVGIVMKLRGKD